MQEPSQTPSSCHAGDGSVSDTDEVPQTRKSKRRVGAGAILVRGGQVLLGKRSEDRSFYPGVWDVIGGHCEDGESPTDAVLRELQEEIGIRALSLEEIAVVAETTPSRHGEGQYHIFVVTAWEGEPSLVNAEHSELRWLRMDQARALAFPNPVYYSLLSAAMQHSS